MYCPNCNSYLSFKKTRCDRCGEDLKLYKKVLSASNQYYNAGLMKAKVRDLSGAVSALKKSLELDKSNTNARNLLGLVYYEMGETVSALSEWVISKHFQNEDNAADQYMDDLQSNPTKLETINQTIKKFNQALAAAKQGSPDLAIIQLKKVTSLNPRFLRALQLLALLYLKDGDKEKAARCLRKAHRIDINNTMTLRFLRELETEEAHSELAAGGENRRKRDENPSFVPITHYKEDKPNIFLFVNLILGVLLGIAVCYFLIFPTKEKQVLSKYRTNQVENNQVLAEKDSKISSLEKDKEDLNSQIDLLTKENKELSDTVTDETIYDNLFAAAKAYVAEDVQGAAESLLKVKEEKLERPGAKKLYQELKSKTFEQASAEFYNQGHEAYTSYKYDEAIELFEKAIGANKDNVDAMYFMGRAYENKGDKEKAAEYYNMIVENYPDSERTNKAKQMLRNLG